MTDEEFIKTLKCGRCGRNSEEIKDDEDPGLVVDLRDDVNLFCRTCVEKMSLIGG